jgi:hypothetical protein
MVLGFHVSEGLQVVVVVFVPIRNISVIVMIDIKTIRLTWLDTTARAISRGHILNLDT